MADGKFKVNRSNFTLRRKHQTTNNGDIYERDWMTDTQQGSWPGETFSYGDSNFKFVRRASVNNTRKHNFGEWLTHTCDGDETPYWSTDCITDDMVSSEGKIEIKPSSSNILDYAYYGSCAELVKNSIRNIIANFPAELYVTENNFTIDSNTTSLGNYSNIVEVSNPFNIDITGYTYRNVKDVSDLRNLNKSFRFYNIVCSTDCKPFAEYSVISSQELCSEFQEVALVRMTTRANTGKSHDFDIMEFYDHGKYRLFTYRDYIGYSIIPNNGVIDDFFASLNRFEKLLLNRESQPKYTCYLECMDENPENGEITTYKKPFIWPTINDHNLDVVSPVFEKYVADLLELAEYYDNGYSNNLVNMLTHDSIKAMDRTFSKENDINDDEDYNRGTSKMESMLYIYGRHFDDIKMDIDNIKHTNNITYNEDDNLPDYFLSDNLELSGWEVTNAVLGLNNTEVEGLYDTLEKKYSLNDANIQFLRNLKLNSKEIFRRKGTKQGIEMILGLFGMKSKDYDENEYDYSIDEYVYEVNGMTVSPDELIECNKLKRDYELTDGYGYTDDLQGLPCALYETESGDKFVTPWFSKNIYLDGNPYFQMYGGWLKKKEDGIYEFTETVKYLGVVKRLEDLATTNITKYGLDPIVYVEDLSDYDYYFGEVSTMSLVSHYFVLSNRQNSGEYNTPEGWNNIPQSDIDNKTNYGYKVSVLERIVDDNVGNNPHVGYDRYDDGSEYVENFKQLFKYSIENDNFTDDAYDCESGELLDDIQNAGFTFVNNGNPIKDNVKCWYFNNEAYTSEDDFKVIVRSEHNGQTSYTSVPFRFDNNYYKNCTLKTSYDSYAEQDNGIPSISGNYTFFDTSINPVSMLDSTNSNDELAANSVINSKRMKITFEPVSASMNPAHVRYIKNAVLPYLQQVIPSTTIIDVTIKG